MVVEDYTRQHLSSQMQERVEPCIYCNEPLVYFLQFAPQRKGAKEEVCLFCLCCNARGNKTKTVINAINEHNNALKRIRDAAAQLAYNGGIRQGQIEASHAIHELHTTKQAIADFYTLAKQCFEDTQERTEEDNGEES